MIKLFSCCLKKKSPSLVHGESVSVVLPVYNGGKHLAALLSAIKKQKGLGKIDVIVVDSGSGDSSLEIAKRGGAKIIKLPQKSFGHDKARNLGAEAAKSEYLLFMTQDALPPDDFWLNKLMRALKKHKAAAASCRHIPRHDADLFERVNIWKHNSFMGAGKKDLVLSMPRSNDYEDLRKNSQLSNVACLIKRDIFSRYKFRMAFAEDLDLGLRLIKDAHRLAMVNSTAVLHSHNRPPYYFLKRAFIDNLTLSKLFPSFKPVKISTAKVAFDSCSTYSVINSFVKCEIDLIKMPCSVEEFIESVIKKLRSIKVGTPISREALFQDRYLDGEFADFIRVMSASSKGTRAPSGRKKVFSSVTSHILRTTRNYLKENFRSLDNLILEDFKGHLYKTLAAKTGALLAASFTGAGKKEKIAFKKIYGQLLRNNPL